MFGYFPVSYPYEKYTSIIEAHDLNISEKVWKVYIFNPFSRWRQLNMAVVFLQSTPRAILWSLSSKSKLLIELRLDENLLKDSTISHNYHI